ncbi:MAG: type I-E CRISPR-associated endoribonuclease Cas2 [Acidimicrobiales bacterium]|nr:type I-E CRISPR-associated endoribonuclease Cas2e [Acidimicrobiaceae bacterium]MXV86610.1 type I-E CRISPR-associated endoribonuclease Cas2 [Acidimicrobiales bacterium]MYA38875.1 type I-E CRISPR-associated endoribonuclease Cas2 [Acidimicrobiia bacterium]MYB82811.1 type I-E CRISPR-associated endoribonuclease Cas2 [Acidimicrobiales bacterium]MYI12092.1 type I-E CRISPR-associated endoribonuclease Cas2 [Acidimicrobiales bacterium]
MNATFVLTAVPPNIRHALTRWMIEPAPGVFVGTMSARVRDELWHIIEGETHGGWAILIHPDTSEQGFAIRTCGTDRRHIVDIDGLQLVTMPAEHLDNFTAPHEAELLS